MPISFISTHYIEATYFDTPLPSASSIDHVDMPPRATKSAPAPDGDDILTLLDASTGLARNVVAQWVGTDASRLSTAAVAPKSTAAAAPEVDRPARCVQHGSLLHV